MESLISLIESILSTDLLLYVGMIVEGIVSIFLWKKSGKTNSTTAQVVDKDLSALIDYHEKVANELRKKNNLK